LLRRRLTTQLRSAARKTDAVCHHLLATFRRKNEVRGCCGRIAQGMENCKVGRI
jgi:hypothetical protein